MNALFLLASSAAVGDDATRLADPTQPTLWSTQLLYYVLIASIAIVGLNMLCCAFRLMRGPHIGDRALAVDTLGVQLVALVILLAMIMETTLFFEAVLVLSLLSFAGTVAMAQYIGRPHEQGKQRDAQSKV